MPALYRLDAHLEGSASHLVRRVVALGEALRHGAGGAFGEHQEVEVVSAFGALRSSRALRILGKEFRVLGKEPKEFAGVLHLARDRSDEPCARLELFELTHHHPDRPQVLRDRDIAVPAQPRTTFAAEDQDGTETNHTSTFAG